MSVLNRGRGGGGGAGPPSAVPPSQHDKNRTKQQHRQLQHQQRTTAVLRFLVPARFLFLALLISLETPISAAGGGAWNAGSMVTAIRRPRVSSAELMSGELLEETNGMKKSTRYGPWTFMKRSPELAELSEDDDTMKQQSPGKRRLLAPFPGSSGGPIIRFGKRRWRTGRGPEALWPESGASSEEVLDPALVDSVELNGEETILIGRPRHIRTPTPASSAPLIRFGRRRRVVPDSSPHHDHLRQLVAVAEQLEKQKRRSMAADSSAPLIRFGRKKK